MIKTKVAFWRAGFYPANHSNLKSNQNALIGWKKPALQISHFCFHHVNMQAIEDSITALTNADYEV